jgi:Abnormal spindle-like microcephaly-assoc'd, ASPM-SPD-2-Hydin
MRLRTRMWAVATTAALLLLAASSGAAADPIAGFDPGGSFTATSNGRLTFGSGEFTMACDVTLSGTLGTLFGLEGGDMLGEVDGMRVVNCSGAAFGTALTPSWALVHDTMLDTLPNAVEGLTLDVDGMEFSITVLGFLRCLYAGNLRMTLDTSGSNPYPVRALVVDRSSSLTRVSGSAPCPSSGGWSGTLTLDPEQLLEAGVFRANPTTRDFGVVAVNESTERSVNLINETEWKAEIERVIVNGHESFIADPATLFAVQRLTMSAIDITFRPLSPGNKAATLEFLDTQERVILQIPVDGVGN